MKHRDMIWKMNQVIGNNDFIFQTMNTGYSWTNLQGLPGTGLLKKLFSPVNETSIDVSSSSSLSSTPASTRRHLKTKPSTAIGIKKVRYGADFADDYMRTIDNGTTMAFHAGNSTNSR